MFAECPLLLRRLDILSFLVVLNMSWPLKAGTHITMLIVMIWALQVIQVGLSIFHSGSVGPLLYKLQHKLASPFLLCCVFLNSCSHRISAVA